LFDASAPKLQFMEDSAIKLDDMTVATPDDDDLVIETVTLGQQEDGDINKRLQDASNRFDNAAEYQAQPQQQQPQMQPPPAIPPQGQPPQQQQPKPGQTPGQQGYPPAQ
jgi:hypothetical protein